MIPLANGFGASATVASLVLGALQRGACPLGGCAWWADIITRQQARCCNSGRQVAGGSRWQRARAPGWRRLCIPSRLGWRALLRENCGEEQSNG